MSTARSDATSLKVLVGARCHVGSQRTENQDRVTQADTPYGNLFVVADGVGGYQGGSEAAQATVDGFASYLAAHPAMSLTEALQRAASSVNADLQQRSAAKQQLRGMGSTVVLCVVSGNHLTHAHVGDSRAYLLRDGQLRALTRDHSIMERMVSHGILTPEQAKEHPDASVLTRALGQGTDASLDIGELTLRSGDALLLCSDGLWAYARHDEMEAIANSSELSPSAIASALLQAALDGGGGDNISIQFLRFEAGKPIAKSIPLPGKRQRKKLIGIAAALIPAVAAAWIFLWIQRQPRLPNQPTSRSGSQGGPLTTAPAREKPLIVIIDGKSNERLLWAEKLRKANYPSVARLSPNDECRAMQQDNDVLLYAKENAEDATEVARILGIPAVNKLQRDLNKCGGGEIIAMAAHRKKPPAGLLDGEGNGVNELRDRLANGIPLPPPPTRH
jgi:serine/threonine protein phosphatase PrpC